MLFPCLGFFLLNRLQGKLLDKGGNVRNLGYVPKDTIANLKDFVFKGPFRDKGMPDSKIFYDKFS